MRNDFDVATARAHFPALQDDWAWMDNAGGSVAPREVIDEVAAHMTHYGVQLGATYPRSERAAGRVADGHRAAEQLLGADEGEVIVGPSTTANLRLLAAGLRPLMDPGDEVIVTDLDHEANRGPWTAWRHEGIRVREWAVRPDTGRLHAEDLEALLGDRTRLVAFTHCANVVGAIHDVQRISAMAHEVGAWACADGVAFAPHRLVDVKAWDVDFYAVSAYKVFGPHVGLLYGKRPLLEAARGQNHDFIPEDRVPYKFQPGGPNHELTSALPGVVRYLRDLASPVDAEDAARTPRAELRVAFDRIAEHEAELVRPLLRWLTQRPSCRVLGPIEVDPEIRVPTVAFTVRGIASREIPPLLERHKLAVRWGHFYAPRAMRAFGLDPDDGVVRISMVHYNTPAEVERLIAALDGIV